MLKLAKLLKWFSSIVFVDLALGVGVFIGALIQAINNPDTISNAENHVYQILNIIEFIIILIMAIGVLVSGILFLVQAKKQEKTECKNTAIIGITSSLIFLVMGIVGFFEIKNETISFIIMIIQFAAWVMMIICFSQSIKLVAQLQKNQEAA